MKKIALLSALLLLAGCATAPVALNEKANGSTVTLNEKANGSTVTVKSGETFTVSLYSNPTTGYTWEVFTAPDAKVCKQASSHYQPDSVDKKMVGAGGKQQYVFQAVAPGKTQLRLHYRRNWEKDVPPAEVFVLGVEVK